jgi:hypothetical protein
LRLDRHLPNGFVATPGAVTAPCIRLKSLTHDELSDDQQENKKLTS